MRPTDTTGSCGRGELIQYTIHRFIYYKSYFIVKVIFFNKDTLNLLPRQDKTNNE